MVREKVVRTYWKTGNIYGIGKINRGDFEFIIYAWTPDFSCESVDSEYDISFIE